MQRLPFHPGYAYRATKPFVMAGVQYSPGMLVDKRGVEDRRLRQMYDAFMVEPCGDPPAVGATRPVRAPEAAPATQVPATPVAAPQAPGKATVEHRGFGRWYVVRDGDVMSGPHTKAEAEAALAAR